MSKIPFVFFLLIYTSLLAFDQPMSSSDKYFVVSQNGKKGLKDDKGKIVIPIIYDNIGWSDGKTAPENNVIGYQINGLWGIITVSNRIISNADYATLTNNETSKILVASKQNQPSNNQLYGGLSNKGKIVIPFNYCLLIEIGEVYMVATQVDDGYNYGLINSSNEVMIPLEYVNIYPISKRLLMVSKNDNYHKLYDLESLNFVWDNLNRIELTDRGNFKIYTGFKCGLIDGENNLLAPIAYKKIEWKDGKLMGLRYSHWTLCNGEYELINEFDCDAVLFKGENTVLTGYDDQRVADRKGVPLTPIFDTVLDVSGQQVVFKEGVKYGAYDGKNKRFIYTEMDSLRLFGEFYYALRNNENGQFWEISDTLQAKRTEYEYQNVRHHHNRLFAVKRNGFWGFIARNGFEVIPCEYDSVGEFVVNDVVVRKGDKEGILSINGKWIVPPRDEKLELLNNIYFLSRGAIETKLENVNGEVVYRTANKIAYKNEMLWEYRQEGGILKIDLKGKLLTANIDIAETEYEEIKFVYDDWVAVKFKGKYGFFDTKLGIIRISTRYEDVGQTNIRNRLIPVKILGKWGAVNRKEELVIQPNYDSIYQFIKGKSITKLDSMYGLIDNFGEVIIQTRYEQLHRQENGRYLSKKENRFGLLDETGKKIITNKHEFLNDTSNGYVIIGNGNKYGVITLFGVNKVPQIYDNIIYNKWSDTYYAETEMDWETIQE